MDMNISERQNTLLDYLKCNCVGRENRKAGDIILFQLKIICPTLFDDKYSKSMLQYDFHRLRNSVDMKIGSDNSGYWLETLEDLNNGEKPGINFLKKLATTHMLTALKQGVPAAYFHTILNNHDEDYAPHNQGKINYGNDPADSDCVVRYSDALKAS